MGSYIEGYRAKNPDTKLSDQEVADKLYDNYSRRVNTKLTRDDFYERAGFTPEQKPGFIERAGDAIGGAIDTAKSYLSEDKGGNNVGVGEPPATSDQAVNLPVQNPTPAPTQEPQSLVLDSPMNRAAEAERSLGDEPQPITAPAQESIVDKVNRYIDQYSPPGILLDKAGIKASDYMPGSVVAKVGDQLSEEGTLKGMGEVIDASIGMAVDATRYAYNELQSADREKRAEMRVLPDKPYTIKDEIPREEFPSDRAYEYYKRDHDMYKRESKESAKFADDMMKKLRSGEMLI